jgi:hypothetical protein
MCKLYVGVYIRIRPRSSDVEQVFVTERIIPNAEEL